MSAPANETPLYQTILLDKAVEFSIDTLKSDIQEVFGAQDLEITSTSQEAFVITWGDFAFTVINVDRPAPADFFAEAIYNATPNDPVRAAVADHKAHLIVSSLKAHANMGQGVMVSIFLMMLSQVITIKFQPLAYMWNLSQTLLTSERYDNAVLACNDALTKKKSGQADAGSSLPVHYWFGLRFYSADPGCLGVMTKGCLPFMGYEVQINPLPWKASELAKRIYGVGSYLLSHGPSMQEGHTLGISQDEHFRVSYTPETDTVPAKMLLSLEKQAS